MPSTNLQPQREKKKNSAIKDPDVTIPISWLSPVHREACGLRNKKKTKHFYNLKFKTFFYFRRNWQPNERVPLLIWLLRSVGTLCSFARTQGSFPEWAVYAFKILTAQEGATQKINHTESFIFLFNQANSAARWERFDSPLTQTEQQRRRSSLWFVLNGVQWLICSRENEQGEGDACFLKSKMSKAMNFPEAEESPSFASLAVLLFTKCEIKHAVL